MFENILEFLKNKTLPVQSPPRLQWIALKRSQYKHSKEDELRFRLSAEVRVVKVINIINWHLICILFRQYFELFVASK